MGMSYTDAGLQMMIDAVTSNNKIRFCRVELESDPERSSRHWTQEAEIIKQEDVDGKRILLTAVTDNHGYDQDCYFNRINVYAQSDGIEYLFCYEQSANCPFYIPAFDGRPIQNEIRIYIAVTSADVIQLTNDGLYVLRSEYEEMIGALLDLDLVDQEFRIVYFGADESDAMDLQDIIEAINTPWQGQSSLDENAMTVQEVDEAIHTPWNGQSSPDRDALTADDIRDVT